MKWLLQTVSPAGARGRLSILIFHRVLPRPDPLFPEEVDAERFDRICSWVRQWFQVLPLDRAVKRLADGSLPARALAITFDDGYADNHDVALPILQRYGLCATFFVATDFLDGGRMWNDTIIESVRGTARSRVDLSDLGLAAGELQTPVQRRAFIDSVLPRIKYLPPARRVQVVEAAAERLDAPLPDDLMMHACDVVALARAGMQIGAHTCSHPILARLDADAARREIAGSKDALQNLLQQDVSLFAYPNGKPGEDYDEHSVSLARQCGFDAAVSTSWGAARRGDDLFQLPRFTPWDRRQWRFGARLWRNLARS